ncbi:uncharacterized protein F5891DRAFT_983435 [Suillus fuscotomentosus]|uniref:Uncharacterized protein n=1 Tax=Suillus fuscotomentosus TaxID=1912939 RepID=A0AAD4HHJ1_9AGAM|nr:uncharacterized protein F5891DRAFT_983435 [Suillus fuscotomentosus]KAG1896426.1 hypothetical protein F5891DRAFT_983435 [Suillus fuscotomentosus]
MHNDASVGPETPHSPSRECLRQCIHIGRNVTLRQFYQNNRLVHRGTQMTVTDEPYMSKLEYELHQVKEQLRDTENQVAALSDKVMTYRYRWLEEYYRADNLEHHMPFDIYVPVLGQIAAGAPSPTYSLEFLEYNEAGEVSGEEHGEEEHL